MIAQIPTIAVRGVSTASRTRLARPARVRSGTRGTSGDGRTGWIVVIEDSSNRTVYSPAPCHRGAFIAAPSRASALTDGGRTLKQLLPRVAPFGALVRHL